MKNNQELRKLDETEPFLFYELFFLLFALVDVYVQEHWKCELPPFFFVATGYFRSHSWLK